MNSRSKLVTLMICSVCFATVWRLSSRLSLEAVEKTEDLVIIQEEVEEIDKSEQTEAVKPCSCNTCLSQYNPWFMQHYQKSVHPFLTSQENLSQEDFNWWKTLQDERGSLTKFVTTKQSLFKIFPSKLDLTEPSPDRCRTCAVVGNSGNLRGSLYGKQIDANDIVIRMNSGITAGYEKDVGTKTTHRVMYPESAINLDNSTHLVLFPFKILDLQWLVDAFTTGFYGRSYAPVLQKIKANRNLVMVVNPAFMKYVHRSWLHQKGRYPSTGFMTLVLALHICDKVNVFGFGADKDGNWNHYWEELKNKHLKTGLHPGSYEYDLIQTLAKQNKTTFYRGW